MSKQIIKCCIDAHKPHFQKAFENIGPHMDPLSFHKEYSLSLNFGRQFGHTSAIIELMEESEEYVLVTDKERHLADVFGTSLFRHLKNDHRVYNIRGNYRGLRLDTGEFKTVLVDRSSFYKSNYNIIEEVMRVARQTFDFYGYQNYRIVILG